ncbi:hypothetical protein FCM35_KLT19930 [Carex littledalei]|uniref:Uncharacterized protein n=1 Tax=Carex littledalei TaxID=544730 RepID=A0A833RI46_9POAL|nr:hypothetical protein FCM35_KLT19930 [Carex littledalei]
MDYSPLISKTAISSSPCSSSPTSPKTPNTAKGTTTNCSFETALAKHDEETGALIPAGGNETVETAVDVAPDSAVPMVVAKDVEKVRNARQAWEVFVNESKVLWAIAAPIAFNIICLYGMNSATQIAVGHVGNLELSAVAVGLSVVSNFSFGFLMG